MKFEPIPSGVGDVMSTGTDDDDADDNVVVVVVVVT